MSEKTILGCKWRVYKSGSTMAMSVHGVQKKESEKYVEEQPGFIFLEFAPSTGKNSYDWKNGKKVFKLGISDLGKILSTEQFKLIHNPSAGKEDADSGRIQVLEFSKFEQSGGKGDGYGMLTLSNPAEKTKISVALSLGEFVIFTELIRAAIPKIIGLS